MKQHFGTDIIHNDNWLEVTTNEKYVTPITLHDITLFVINLLCNSRVIITPQNGALLQKQSEKKRYQVQVRLGIL
jgi:ABC-type metal ion transport system substrate-binding protein